MSDSAIAVDFNYWIHDLMTSYQNSFCGTDKVPPDFVSAICYAERLPAVPNTFVCENPSNAVSVITIIAELAI
jgi:hypothetical protein